MARERPRDARIGRVELAQQYEGRLCEAVEAVFPELMHYPDFAKKMDDLISFLNEHVGLLGVRTSWNSSKGPMAEFALRIMGYEGLFGSIASGDEDHSTNNSVEIAAQKAFQFWGGDWREIKARDICGNIRTAAKECPNKPLFIAFAGDVVLKKFNYETGKDERYHKPDEDLKTEEGLEKARNRLKLILCQENPYTDDKSFSLVYEIGEAWVGQSQNTSQIKGGADTCELHLQVRPFKEKEIDKIVPNGVANAGIDWLDPTFMSHMTHVNGIPIDKPLARELLMISVLDLSPSKFLLAIQALKFITHSRRRSDFSVRDEKSGVVARMKDLTIHTEANKELVERALGLRRKWYKKGTNEYWYSLKLEEFKAIISDINLDGNLSSAKALPESGETKKSGLYYRYVGSEKNRRIELIYKEDKESSSIFRPQLERLIRDRLGELI